jgi:hypothetical protein
MPTLVISQRLGEAIRRLTRGYYQFYWMTQTGAEAVHEEVIDELKKAKLISERAFSPYGDRHLYHLRGTRRIYEATEFAKQFRLPPTEFWVPDEPVSAS